MRLNKIFQYIFYSLTISFLSACGGGAPIEEETSQKVKPKASPSLLESSPQLSTASYIFRQQENVSRVLINSGGEVKSCSSSPALPPGLLLKVDQGSCLLFGNTDIIVDNIYTINGVNEAGHSSVKIAIKVVEAISDPIDTAQIKPNLAESTLSGTVNLLLSTVVNNSGGVADRCFASPALPTGLVISAISTGCKISGIVTTDINRDFLITAGNSQGTDTSLLTVNITHPLARPIISKLNDVNLVVGNIADIHFDNVGGDIESCIASPQLSHGLAINHDTDSCVISGTVNAVFTQRYNVTASNSAGSSNAHVRIVSRSDLQSPKLVEVGSYQYETDQDINIVIDNAGGLLEECSIDPELPAGLKIELQQNSCVISGTSSERVNDKPYKVIGINASGRSELQMNLTLSEPVDRIDQSLILDVVADSYVNGGNKSDAVFNENRLLAQSSSKNYTREIFLAFNQQELINTEINNAYLKVYIDEINTNPGTAQIEIQKVNFIDQELNDRSFDEASLNYSLSSDFIVNGAKSSAEFSKQVHERKWTWIDIKEALGDSHNYENLQLKINNSDEIKSSRIFIQSKEHEENHSPVLIINADKVAPKLIVDENNLTLQSKELVTVEILSHEGLVNDCTLANGQVLPIGLTLKNEKFSCVVTGVASFKQDKTPYLITAINTTGRSTIELTLAVSAAPTSPSIVDQSLTVLKNEVIDIVLENIGDDIDNCVLAASSPSLPSGLLLSSSATGCIIKGAITEDQLATSYIITASNAQGSSTALFTLTVTDPAPILSDTTVSQGYDQALELIISNNGGVVDSCSITPELPTGLNLIEQNNSCAINGSISQIHNQDYSVIASNEAGSDIAQIALIFTAPETDLEIAPNIELPGSIGYFGGLITQKFKPNENIKMRFINDGGEIEHCNINPELPSGLTLQLIDNGCEIIGQSNVEVPVETYQVTADNAYGEHSAGVKFKVEIRRLAPRIEDKNITLKEREEVEIILPNLVEEDSYIDSCTQRRSLPVGMVIIAENNSCVIRGAAKLPSPSTQYLIDVKGPGGSFTGVVYIEVEAAEIDLLAEVEYAEDGNANNDVHALAPKNVIADYNFITGNVDLNWQSPLDVNLKTYRIEYGCIAEGIQFPVVTLDTGVNTSASISHNVGEKCVYIISTITNDLDKYSWKAFLDIGPGRFSGPRSLIGLADEQSVKLSWQVPSQIPDTLNQYRISGYKIYRKNLEEGIYNDIGTIIGSLSYMDHTVTSGTDYAYKVAALITGPAGQEESRSSNQLNNLSLEILSSVPQAIQLRAAYLDGQVILDWQAPIAGRDIASDILITGYQVYRKQGSSSDETNDYTLLLADSGSDKTFFIDESAQPKTEYSYKVNVIAEERNSGSNVVGKVSDSVQLIGFTALEDLPLVNMITDANRDGILNAEDNFGEDYWNSESGAVFGPNLDDDDGDRIVDGRDNKPNGEQDFSDMAKVVFQQIPDLLLSDEVILDISYDFEKVTTVGKGIFERNDDQEPKVLFYDSDVSSWVKLNNRDQYPVNGNTISAEISESELRDGDITVYVDSLYGRHPGFDGHVAMTLKVEREGVVIAQDSVALRGAPVLYSHVMQQARRVFITDKSWAPVIPLYDAIDSRLEPTMSMAGQEQPSYWAQDAGQFSYSQRPGQSGLDTTFIGTRLPSGTTDWFGYTDEENGLIDFASLGSDKINAGGNVEIIPPYTHNGVNYPLGRIIVGGSIDTSLPIETKSLAEKRRDLYPPIIDFFTSQAVQGPPIVVPSAWLTIGHIDEIFKFLPNLNAGPGERPWVVAIAAPEKALEIEDREHELNVNLQKYVIDEIKEVFKQEVGLTEKDFIELPMLYSGNGGSRYSSVINMQAVGDELYVPKPFAKEVDGVDPFEEATREALEALGYNVHFISIKQTYFSPGNGGGIHCGTNVEFYPVVDVPWWASER